MAIIVYKHTNNINNKVYIGQTSVSLNSRWRNGRGYQTTPHFWAAIQKYGWENFSHEILAETEDILEANKLEQYYIELYQATNPDFGYNIALGGKNHLHSDQEKEHISQVMKEKWQDPAFKEYMKQSHIGVNHNHSSKKVLCIETQEIYNSQLEAARAVGLKSSAGISRCCLGQRQTAQGYHWAFIMEDK